MATTWMKAVHRSNSGSISAGLKQTIDYAKNPDKTQGGELTAAYECDLAQDGPAMTTESEFLLSKTLYEQRTGRNQGRYDLAMRWAHGRHQFIVAAHTNTANPHTHIFFNSVDLDCSRKFEDFRRSAIALRKISDILCLENGLSIIEKPGLSKGRNRAGGGLLAISRGTDFQGSNGANTVRGTARAANCAAVLREFWL